MRGREHPIVLPDALHVIMMFPWCSRLCIRLPQRDAYPSGCDGNRTRYGLLAKPWPVDLRPHPTILFPGLPAGESDPVAGGRTPCCWSDTSDSRGARPGRQLTRALPPAPPADRATSATPAGVADELGEDIPNLSASVTARATSATLALYAFGDDSHHLPAPSRGKKERKPFLNSASVQERYYGLASHQAKVSLHEQKHTNIRIKCQIDLLKLRHKAMIGKNQLVE